MIVCIINWSCVIMYLDDVMDKILENDLNDHFVGLWTQKAQTNENSQFAVDQLAQSWSQGDPTPDRIALNQPYKNALWAEQGTWKGRPASTYGGWLSTTFL